MGAGEGQGRELWNVYLLRCADDSVYCGIARNLARRLAQHNGQIAGGARYTRGRRPVRLLAFLVCQGKGDALRFEAAVKGMSRKDKLRLFQVEGDF